MRQSTIGISGVITALILGVSAPVFAELSPPLNQEASELVERLAGSPDEDVRMGVTLVRGYLNIPEPEEKGKKKKRRKKKGEVNKVQQEALVALKGDPKRRVRLAAGYGLDVQGDSTALAFLQEQLSASEVTEAVYDQVVSLFPNDFEVELFEKLVADKSFTQRQPLYAYLARQGSPELFAIFAKDLQNPAWTAIATPIAKRTRRPELLPAAAQMIASASEEVRRNGIAIVGSVARLQGVAAQVAPILVSALGNSDEEVVKQAALLLLETKQSDQRKKGIDALLALATKEAAKEGGAGLAARTLSLLVEHEVHTSKKQVEAFLSNKDGGVALAAYQIGAQDAGLKTEILKMIPSTDFSKRTLGLLAAGFTGSPEAAQLLSQSLFEGRTDVRRISSQGLVRLKEPSTLEALKKSLSREPDKETKLNVIEAIGRIGTDEAVTLLRFQSRDKDPVVKVAVAKAIGLAHNPSASAALEALTKDRNNDVQWQAFLGLLGIDLPAAKRAFERVFRNPHEGFIAEIDELSPEIREVIYRYLLTEHSGRARDEALAQVMSTGESLEDVYRLALDDSLLPRVRRKVLIYLADLGSDKANLVLDNVARTSKKEEIGHLAAWLLVRKPEAQEATFRGFLLGKDDVKKASGILGIVLREETLAKAEEKGAKGKRSKKSKASKKKA